MEELLKSITRRGITSPSTGITPKGRKVTFTEKPLVVGNFDDLATSIKARSMGYASPDAKELESIKADNLLGIVPDQYRGDILNLSETTGIDPRYMAAMLHTENQQWDPKAKNPKPGSTATGLGQHTDAFWKEYNPKFKKEYGKDYDRKNPHDSIAATYIGMKDILDRVGGNIEDAIQAYHTGVAAWKEGKRAPEYLRKVKSFMHGL